MAAEPTWQPNYVDLSDDRTFRLGGQCLVCGARYESPVARLDLDPAFGFAMRGALEQELGELKFRTFADFDAAYKEITYDCPRCGRHACVDCWDTDHGMCGACVASFGLKRSPHRGVAGEGPLADGRLRCVEHGQFSDAAQPSWLDALLSADPQQSGDLPQDVTDSSWLRHVSSVAPDPAAVYPGAAPTPNFSMSLHQTGTLAHEPTAKITSLSGSAAQPGIGELPQEPFAPFPHADDSFPNPEGRVTSTKVKCPRCGAANYDFVTNCSNCQLQLIQNCPMCGKLNPGHAHACEFCGSSLDRPRGWSAIEDQVQPLSANESHAAPPRPPRPPKKPRTAKHKASAQPTAPVRPEPFTIDPNTGALAVPSLLPAAYFESSAVREEVEESDELSFGERLLLAFERVITIVFWLTILTLAIAITASEVSPHANEAIRSATHIDIRATLAHFGTWAQRKLSRGK